MKQDTRETQRVYFNYAFSINPEAIGMDAGKFRKILSERLGFEASSCYQPLNNCSLYRPLTKRRHHINKAYIKAIDPRRWSLPIAEDIYSNRAVTFPHRILLSSEAQIHLIANTIKTILLHN
jgi:L-glutamine:2-deoxy-scyllo-inosose/3-amino-2,3-dideoxy-scyllo-inosose aminotransferase